jgi:hypothetical protein
MNHTQALLMCIPATTIAISVLIWLQSIHHRISDHARLRAMQEGHEQRIKMRRHRNRSQQAAPSSEPITVEERRGPLGGDGAAMPRVGFDVASGFSGPGQRN